MADKYPIVYRTNTLGQEELRYGDNLSIGDGRIVKLADPIDNTDAVNLQYLKSYVTVAAFSISATNINHWNEAYSWGNHAGLYDPIGSVSTHETTYDHSDIWGAGAENQLWTQGADGNPVSETNLTFDGTLLKSPQYGSPSDLILVPTGTGAIQVGTSGNARGQYAIDLQAVRVSDDQVASGNYSIILGGSNNTCAQNNAICCGESNVIEYDASGQYNSILSSYLSTISSGSGTKNIICGGDNHTISAFGGVYKGTSTIVGGYANEIIAFGATIIGGYLNLINDLTELTTYSFIGGGSHNTINCQFAAIVGGTYNELTGSTYSTIIGGRENSITDSLYSLAAGGYDNTIPTGCADSNVLIGGRNNSLVSATVSNGYNSISGGYGNSIQGSYNTICGGRTNSIELSNGVTYSVICGGVNNTINCSTRSFIGGGYLNTITGDFAAIPGGNAALADKYGQIAHAAGQFTSVGDAQTSILVARKQTTNATPVVLLTNGGSNPSYGGLRILENTTWFFTIKCIARQTNDDYSTASYHIEGIITRDSGGNATIINQSTIYSHEEDLTWDFVVDADTTYQTLRLTATGATDNNINWVARVELVEVSG